jgi:hypothetical protein
MPKDEFDFNDPLELNGVAFQTHEDSTAEMAETFIEEFMRIGYGHKQILALFRNPHYLGPNLALEKRGEPFIRDLIAEVFARWGRPVVWPESTNTRPEELRASGPALDTACGIADTSSRPEDQTLTDPMGAPIPKLNL